MVLLQNKWEMQRRVYTRARQKDIGRRRVVGSSRLDKFEPNCIPVCLSHAVLCVVRLAFENAVNRIGDVESD